MEIQVAIPEFDRTDKLKVIKTKIYDLKRENLVYHKHEDRLKNSIIITNPHFTATPILKKLLHLTDSQLYKLHPILQNVL